MRDLYEASGDWDLALSGYNGGFIWKYLEKCGQEKKKPSYEGFLRMIEGRINSIIRAVKHMKAYEHKIRGGESLDGIAAKYGVEKSEIEKINHDRIKYKKGEPVINAGRKIRIPMNNKSRKIVFEKWTRGFRENLNYPGKFRAVIRAMQEPDSQRVAGGKVTENFRLASQ